MDTFASGYIEKIAILTRGTIATDASGATMTLDRALGTSVEMVIKAGAAGGKVMIIGNGGSAGIASHISTDLWKNGGIRATAFNDPSLLTCVGNDYGYKHVFEKPVEMFGEMRDVLIAISSSGKSENILLGVAAARKHKAAVVTMSGFGEDNPLRMLGDVNFYVPSPAYGPVEVIHHEFCHAILDLLMVRQGKLNAGHFRP